MRSSTFESDHLITEYPPVHFQTVILRHVPFVHWKNGFRVEAGRQLCRITADSRPASCSPSRRTSRTPILPVSLLFQRAELRPLGLICEEVECRLKCCSKCPSSTRHNIQIARTCLATSAQLCHHFTPTTSLSVATSPNVIARTVGRKSPLRLCHFSILSAQVDQACEVIDRAAPYAGYGEAIL